MNFPHIQPQTAPACKKKIQYIKQIYLPRLVKCGVTGSDGGLDAVATRSEDGKTLVLQGSPCNWGWNALSDAPQSHPARQDLTTSPAKTGHKFGKYPAILAGETGLNFRRAWKPRQIEKSG
jgi:hypothetical protein